MRTCGRPFSILINANNELFSVWLGADPARRGQPPPGPAYSCTNDRFYPSSLSRNLIRSLPNGNSSRSSPALSRPTDRQSSCGFDSDEGEPQYRFRWDTCPSFFSLLHRSSSVLTFRNSLALSSLATGSALFFLLSLSHSVTNSRN